MSAHTPGPWDYNASDGTVRDRHDGVIAMMGGSVLRATAAWADVVDRNGRVIAAAPDLLAALRLTLDAILAPEFMPERADAITSARRAIAKAEGRA